MIGVHSMHACWCTGCLFTFISSTTDAPAAEVPEATPQTTAAVAADAPKRNQLVYMDVTIGGKSAGRITIEVRAVLSHYAPVLCLPFSPPTPLCP